LIEFNYDLLTEVCGHFEKGRRWSECRGGRYLFGPETNSADFRSQMIDMFLLGSTAQFGNDLFLPLAVAWAI
jgi:hypothetical protein